MQWYYVDQGTQIGPKTDEEFLDLYSSGMINDQTMVWNETLTAWQSYGSVHNDSNELPSVNQSHRKRYAGFWIRFAAHLIDSIVTSIVTIPLNMVLQITFPQAISDKTYVPILVGIYLMMFIIPAVYFIWMNGKYGATLGKMAVGIKIVTPEGLPIHYGLAAGRYLAQIISSLILYIGYIMAGFDEEKRTLHDRICNTRVVYK